MNKLLYNIAILLLDGYTRVSALFNKKAKLFVEGRKNQQIQKDLQHVTRSIIWFHCASVGEFEQGAPIMEAIKRNFNDKLILVTFFSPSGFEAINNNELIDFKYYLPLDYKKNAKQFIHLVNPAEVFFVKYEFWYHYLEELHKKSIPTYSVSSIFRSNQPFFKWYGSLHRQLLNFFDQFFVQDAASKELLAKLGIASKITGDTRFDRVIAIKETPFSSTILDQFIADSKVIVVGSMRDEDVKLITSFILTHDHIKFIVAPHEIHAQQIETLQISLKNAALFSNFQETDVNKQVLIIDNIGMLSKLYRYGKYAYIGGGFSDGLHNILEPAVYEIPVFFGNKEFNKFKEAIDLIELGAAFPVGSTDEMSRVFADLEHGDQRYRTIQSELQNYVYKNKGAADKILKALE